MLIDIHIYKDMCVHIDTQMYIEIHRGYMYTETCIYAHRYIYGHTNMHVQAQFYTHVHRHRYEHRDIQIHMCSSVCKSPPELIRSCGYRLLSGASPLMEGTQIF